VATLPTAVGELSQLRELHFNRDMRTVPIAVQRLKNLESLRLSVEVVPEWLFGLSNLRELDLSYSDIKEFPSDIRESYIENLNLFYCENLQTLPEFGLPYLKRLDFSTTAIKEIPESILECSHLEYIRLNDAITDIPQRFEKMEKLREIIHSGYSLSDSSIELIERIEGRWYPVDNPKPEWASKLLQWSEKSDLDLPHQLYKLENITKLSSGFREVSVIPKEIEKLKNLTELSLFVSRKLGGFHHLRELPNLKHLSLYNRNHPFKAPSKIGELLNLESLTLNSVNYISPTIFKAQFLTELSIEESKIRSIPHEIGRLTRLKSLTISDVKIVSTLPKEIGQLRSLQKLTLRNLPDLKSIPPTIGSLENLRELSIENCHSLHIVPVTLFKLKRLKSLNVTGTPIKYLSKYIGLLKSVRYLTLHSTTFKIIPKEVGYLTKLLKLSVSGESLPKEIKHLKLLRELKTEVLKPLPAEIGQLQKLKFLDLSDSNFKSLPNQLGDLSLLKSVDLTGCRPGLFGNSPEFRGLYNLENLTLSRGAINRLPEPVTSLPKLLSFSIKDSSSNPNQERGILGGAWIPRDEVLINSKHPLYNGEELWVIKLIDWIGDHCSCENGKRPRTRPELLSIEILKCNCNGYNSRRLRKLPEELSRLQNLKYLDVMEGTIESIPDEFSELKNLKKLLINQHYLKSYPDSFSNYFKAQF
jgi:Leucine-rich repeat (LRR) protein